MMRELLHQAIRRIRSISAFGKRHRFENLLEMPRYREHTVTLNDKPFRIADGTSFYWSYREIFLDEIYRFDATSSRPRILDCGADYGTSIVYFKHLYPDARIVAVEPDPSIFEILEWNVSRHGFQDVELHRRALSARDGPLTWYHEGADGGRTHFLGQARTTFEVQSANLDEFLRADVDFLKMDIEGEETEVICSSKRIGNVGQMFIEYHSFTDTNQTLHVLLEKLSGCGFRYYINEQFASQNPLVEPREQLGMDLQLNIFAKKVR